MNNYEKKQLEFENRTTFKLCNNVIMLQWISTNGNTTWS